MRQAQIFYKEEEAGLLTQHDDDSYSFEYHDYWITNSNKPAISLTLPKSSKTFSSNFLFSFFYNMLPEGANKYMVCTDLKIDKDDYFSLLLYTAQNDTIGAVTVKPIDI